MHFERWLIDATPVVVRLEEGRPAESWLDLRDALAGQSGCPTLLDRARNVANAPRRLAPVAPSKVVCVGLNYRAHALEMNKPLPEVPLLFLKPPSAVANPGQAIELPADAAEVHHEGELAVVVGKPLRDATVEEAQRAIFGYTILNDVTARDIQRAEGQRFTRAKGFDTFAPCGPAIIQGLDPASLRIRTWVDDDLRQDGGCDDLIFPIPVLLAFISRVMTLEPGDLVSTGTPSGVGAILPGQRVRVEIDGIGCLENPVIARRQAPWR